jgi:hypothetical protein
VAQITVADVPDFDEDTYPLRIESVEERKITPKRGDNAGQEIEVFEWRAALLEDDWKTPVLDRKTGEELYAKTLSSKASGPRSKLNGFLVALLGPSAVEPGNQIDTRDLKGLFALGSIVADDGGYPKIDSMTARPRSRRTVREEATEAPAAAATPVASSDADEDDLPF